MLAIAEKCKIELSSQDKTEFLLENITDTEDIDYIITRRDLEHLLENTLEIACNRVDEALLEAGIQDIDISHVLLTGGTCYIPAIQNRMIEKFGHRVESVKNADLLIAQGAAVISELGWRPFLTKDIQIQLSDDSYWSIFERDFPIVPQKEVIRKEEFICVDQTSKQAKVIVCEGVEQESDRTLAILNVQTLGDKRFGDDILVEAKIDKDIVLTVSAHSKMSIGYKQPEEEYSTRVTREIHQVCFGLEFGGWK